MGGGHRALLLCRKEGCSAGSCFAVWMLPQPQPAWLQWGDCHLGLASLDTSKFERLIFSISCHC